MRDMFEFSDELGPFKIIHVYEPSVGLKGVLVVDNVARGPSVGGVRMAPDVSTRECFRLARAMTLKNAAADLAHGGGKSVLYGDPKMPLVEKERLIRAFACSLREVEQYVFAPDMGTDEQCMAWIKDEVDRVVGLPRELGGIPLDEIGATGWGLRQATEVAMHHLDRDIHGSRIVVQGFGAVGQHAARFLSDLGAIMVGVADSRGALHDSQGIDIDELIKLKRAGKSVVDFPHGERLSRDAVLDIECDIWIPAARPDVVNENNVARLNTRLVVEGANIPITPKAEKMLHDKGTLCIPDFVANAGGVICAAMEFRGASEAAVFEIIEDKIRRNTEQILETIRTSKLTPREAATKLALTRVKKAMGWRRWSVFNNA